MYIVPSKKILINNKHFSQYGEPLHKVVLIIIHRIYLYTIGPLSPPLLLTYFIYTLYTFWPLTSCCLLCSSLSLSSRACLLFLSSSAFFFASSSPDLAKFSNLALIFLAPSEPEYEKLPSVYRFIILKIL